jgi:hypothetical protein
LERWEIRKEEGEKREYRRLEIFAEQFQGIVTNYCYLRFISTRTKHFKKNSHMEM